MSIDGVVFPLLIEKFFKTYKATHLNNLIHDQFYLLYSTSNS